MTDMSNVVSTTGIVGAPIENESTGLSEGAFIAIIVVPVVAGVILAVIIIYFVFIRRYQLKHNSCVIDFIVMRSKWIETQNKEVNYNKYLQRKEMKPPLTVLMILLKQAVTTQVPVRALLKKEPTLRKALLNLAVQKKERVKKANLMEADAKFCCIGFEPQ
jgi:hypothetical protein